MTVALAGAGLIVYVVELERVDASVQREVEQELDEFGKLQKNGIDPAPAPVHASTPSSAPSSSRNVPDDDELLVGWVDDEPRGLVPGRTPRGRPGLPRGR